MANLHYIPVRIANILIELTSPLSAGELGIERGLGPFRAAGAADHPLARVALCWEESSHPPAPRGDLIYAPVPSGKCTVRDRIATPR